MVTKATAAELREKAAEYRLLAKSAEESIAAQLITLAEDYEDLAREIETSRR